MVKLTARSPAAERLPLTIGEVTIREEDASALTLLTPLGDPDETGAAEALKAAHGMAWPAANRVTGREGARALWFGHPGKALLMGPAPDAALGGSMVVVDQSDGWCVVRLDGPAAREVLARVVPLDLRASVFRRGHAARTLIGHMPGALARLGDESWQILVFRSMARTLVHELETAARGVAARARP